MRVLLVAAVCLMMLAPAAAAAPGPSVQEDIYLPAYQNCLWKGSYKPLVSAGDYTVWHYTCDDPHS